MSSRWLHRPSGPWLWPKLHLLPGPCMPSLMQSPSWSFWLLGIGVNLDPVVNNPWNVWVFLFHQWTVTCTWLRSLWGSTGAIIIYFSIPHTETQSFLQSMGTRSENWKLVQVQKLGKSIWGPTSLNLLFIHSVLIKCSINQCPLAAQLFCP